MPDLPPDLEGKKSFEIPFLLCYNNCTACGVSAKIQLQIATRFFAESGESL